MPGASLPGRVVPCLPSVLGLSGALHALLPPAPWAPRAVSSHPSPLPPAPPAHGACLSPALSSTAGQGAPRTEPTTAPPSTAPSRGTPAPNLACGSPKLLLAPSTTTLAPVSARTWSAEPRSWDKGCPKSPVWPSPWPWTRNLPRRALVQEAAGLRLESWGGKSIWH